MTSFFLGWDKEILRKNVIYECACYFFFFFFFFLFYSWRSFQQQVWSFPFDTGNCFFPMLDFARTLGFSHSKLGISLVLGIPEVLGYRIWGPLSWNYWEILCIYCVSPQTCLFIKYIGRAFLIYHSSDVIAIAYVYFLLSFQYFFACYLDLLRIIYMLFPSVKRLFPNFGSNLSKLSNLHSSLNQQKTNGFV